MLYVLYTTKDIILMYNNVLQAKVFNSVVDNDILENTYLLSTQLIV